MAAEITKITDGNHDEIACYLDHILTDLHTALEKLERIGALTDKHDALLDEFRPLLDQFRSPAAAYVAQRRALKAQQMTIGRRSKYREEDGNG